jgi:hypothetical protein
MAQTVSSRLGLEVIVVDAGNESEIDKALASAVQHGADAVYSGSDAFINSHEACRMKWQDYPAGVYALWKQLFVSKKQDCGYQTW